ncbi:hypothetical protein PROPHIGD91-2_32 [Mycobacterium phage prophiGD91-2]|nr:hypothetical protein PROPHIGD91-2_32 [Mycobacterium phage prophiGD91-2]SIJ02189.1 Uncharacterised protein [Mycobacteroides abscessus subsp. bolletii]SLD37349.1 Uncharacterised protein [Mycobacteroides abscessus subsp. bolletii]
MSGQIEVVSTCANCGSGVVLSPVYDADAEWRWIHIASRAYRCMLFAAPSDLGEEYR